MWVKDSYTLEKGGYPNLKLISFYTAKNMYYLVVT